MSGIIIKGNIGRGPVEELEEIDTEGLCSDKRIQSDAKALIEAMELRMGPGKAFPPIGDQAWQEEMDKILGDKPLVDFISPEPNPIECGRCGMCCERMTVSFMVRGNPYSIWNKPRPEDVKDIELLRRILVRIESEEGSENRDWYRCSMLHKDKNGVSSCLIYDSRPNLCRIFEPGDPTCSSDAPCKSDKWNLEDNDIHEEPIEIEVGNEQEPEDE